jgi:long-chain acyl-CoA synthetase
MLSVGGAMEKIWLKSYPPGMPADINPEAYPSIASMFADAVSRFPDRVAYTNFGRDLTFRELDAKSRAFAAWLQHEALLRKGDRIAIMLPNILQYPIAMYGALRAGLVVVNTNPLYTARELEHQLKDSGAKAIVVYEQAAHVLEHCIDHTDIQRVLVTSIGDLIGFPRGPLIDFVIRHVRRQVPRYALANAVRFVDALEQGKWVDLDPVDIKPTDLAFLQYTGGTTGVSKGAMLTQRNMVANTIQTHTWLQDFVPNDGSQQIIVGALPMYHIFALTAVSLVWLNEGGKVLLITNPRDMPGFVRELCKHRVTIFYGVNTLFNGLMHTPGFEKIDFTGLVATNAGGMALQGAVAERWKEATGCILSQGWGLTETSPVATTNPHGVDFNNSIGLPVPSTEISIRDDVGCELPVGQVGEICVRGPQVMAGYWQRPDETAAVMLPDGWLRTGDVGRMDAAGFIYIEDRKKDMILVSGFNVYPNEVEGVIARHPGVLEVAAIAQPDERSGECVVVFVVRKDPTLTAESIIEFARQDLTSYKVPRHVYFRDELPKTNVGKILRRALRDALPPTV